MPAGHYAALASAANNRTLDELFCRNAAYRPDALALLDPPDRGTFTDGPVRRLTYTEADRAVSALAARLHTLGLLPGSVVAFQLPNIVESVITLLGIQRAGFVAAPIPLLWRQAEAARALGQTGAGTLIASAPIGDTNYAEVALQIAAETLSIRFVCGFGTDVSDGMVPLGDVFAADPHLSSSGSDRSADDAAVITFEVSAQGPSPVTRTSAELLAGGVAALEAGAQEGAAMLSTMLMSSFAALATSVVPWLLTGGSLSLHQPFDSTVLSTQLTDTPTDLVVVPGALVSQLADAGLIGKSGGPAVLALWRSPERQPGSGAWSGDTPLIDVLAFGEQGLLALRRGSDGMPPALKASPLVATPSSSPDAEALINLVRTSTGTLALGGAMVPHTSSTRPWVDTGYACRLDPATNAITLTGAPPGVVTIGGYRFASGELQDMVGRAGPDSLLATLPSLLTGQKLAGAATDPAAIRNALFALGISPLVGSAFRYRRDGKRAPAA